MMKFLSTWKSSLWHFSVQFFNEAIVFKFIAQHYFTLFILTSIRSASHVKTSANIRTAIKYLTGAKSHLERPVQRFLTKIENNKKTELEKARNKRKASQQWRRDLTFCWIKDAYGNGSSRVPHNTRVSFAHDRNRRYKLIYFFVRCKY